ncbi:MAG: TonB-dependent receptor [Chitinophagaceae bacterium]
MRKDLFRGLLVLLLTAFSISTVLAQSRAISGVIKDEDGNALPGATISVKNTRLNTSTNDQGIFKLEVPVNAKTLVASYVGKLSKEIAIGTQTVISIILNSNSVALNDVVVVGYGKAKRANLTAAQTTITSQQIEQTVNTTIEQALQGRSAGVFVTQNSGQPGGGISVNIRGISSINGSTQPLYVVDGVQIQSGQDVNYGGQSSADPLAGLNPEDVEDIQILQGPSATAIYGSRGTNGVVLITTKKGKAGTAKLNYGFLYNIQTPPKHLDVMNLQQYATLVKAYHRITGGVTPTEFLDSSILGKGTDWQSELFENAPMSKHQLSMSGGNDKTTYYMSGEYLNQDGIALGSGFKRYGFRANLDNKPREWITIGTTLAFNQTNENLTSSQESVISDALRLTPQIPVKNLDGSWGGGDIVNGSTIYAPVNPIAIANLKTNKFVRREFLGGLNLGINLTKDLVFRSSFNTRIGYSNSLYYLPTYSIGYAINVAAAFNNTNNINTYWGWNQQLQYTKQIGKHSVDAMFTHESQASQWNNTGAGRTGYLTNDILDINAGDPTTASNSGGSGNWGMESYLGRLNYNYDNRYLLSGTVRKDGSSNFGPDNRWGTFPSISAAWRVSNEDFFNVPAISELKLRFETGLTGNQGSGGIYSPLSTGATPTGTGFLPSVYSNPGLKWEQTNTVNYGLNVGLLKNRITLEIDYYNKKTDNLLMVNPLPWYMGTNGQGSVGAPTVNLGSLQTKGWGFTINTTNIATEDFKWETNLNLSSFKTTIEKFNSDKAFVDRISWWMDNWTQRSAVGQAPWLFRGYVEDGLFQSVDEIKKSAVPVDNSRNRFPIDPNNGIWVGDVKYKDLSGPNGKPDGKIDVYDETYIGNPWPKLYGGFTNSFSYKNFDLSILITGTFGNDIYNYMAKRNSDPDKIYTSTNLLTSAMNYARLNVDGAGNPILENPGTNVPRFSNGVNGNYSRATTKWVEDGSYVRIKNISLSYHLPPSLLKKTHFLQGLKATFGVQNAFTFTKYSGFDPEVGSYVGGNVSATTQSIGLDFGRYPITPVYIFAVNVNF